MARIALGLEYNGAAYCGWQTQPLRCAVQDIVETALGDMAGERIATVCAGRTDAGVHALGQVVHFNTTAQRPRSAWMRGVNALLGDDVAVLWAVEVPDTFHARYSARERCYRYLLLNHPQRPALDHGRVGWCHAPLDVEPMQAAARTLLGEHDFSAFRSSECQAKSPIRDVRQILIGRCGDYLVFELTANAFLHHMVRNIIGCLVQVGKGLREPAWLGKLLACRDRKMAAPTFDAAGLYLARVSYDAQWGLPALPVRALPGADVPES